MPRKSLINTHTKPARVPSQEPEKAAWSKKTPVPDCGTTSLAILRSQSLVMEELCALWALYQALAAQRRYNTTRYNTTPHNTNNYFTISKTVWTSFFLYPHSLQNWRLLPRHELLVDMQVFLHSLGITYITHYTWYNKGDGQQGPGKG